MARDEISEADDGALAAAITRRDEAAMAEAVRRHRGPVFAFARRLVGDNGRAEEISQEVFLRLWERSSRFDNSAGRCARSSSRSPIAERSTSSDPIPRVRRAKARRNRKTSPEAGVEAEVVAQTVAEALHRALSQLPDNERQAVELAYFGGHSYRTVAQMLNEPEGTIKGRIRSGLGRLRSALAAQDLQGP